MAQTFINLVLASKGGVGKTKIATYLTEYLQIMLEKKMIIIDTDASNIKLKSIKALEIDKFNLIGNDGLVSSEKMSTIAREYGKRDIVIDTGANSYQAWISYFTKSYGADELTAFGSKLLIHCIVANGMYDECIKCLEELCSLQEYLSAQIVVWLNNGYATNSQSQHLKTSEFYNTDVYKKNRNFIAGVVEMPFCITNNRQFVNELENCNYTLSQIAEYPLNDISKLKMFGRECSILEKKRAINYRKEIFTAISVLDPIYADKKSKKEE